MPSCVLPSYFWGKLVHESRRTLRSSRQSPTGTMRKKSSCAHIPPVTRRLYTAPSHTFPLPYGREYIYYAATYTHNPQDL